MDCIFCKIIKGEIPCYKILEDDKFIAFLDIKPINVGHTLVVPKKHSQFISEMDDSDLEKIMVFVKKINNTLRKSLIKCQAINFEIADGKEAGQEIPHVHLHLIPRFSDDGYSHKYPKNYNKSISSEDFKKVAEKINCILHD